MTTITFYHKESAYGVKAKEFQQWQVDWIQAAIKYLQACLNTKTKELINDAKIQMLETPLTSEVKGVDLSSAMADDDEFQTIKQQLIVVNSWLIVDGSNKPATLDMGCISDIETSPLKDLGLYGLYVMINIMMCQNGGFLTPGECLDLKLTHKLLSNYTDSKTSLWSHFSPILQAALDAGENVGVTF